MSSNRRRSREANDVRRGVMVKYQQRPNDQQRTSPLPLSVVAEYLPKIAPESPDPIVQVHMHEIYETIAILTRRRDDAEAVETRLKAEHAKALESLKRAHQDTFMAQDDQHAQEVKKLRAQIDKLKGVEEELARILREDTEVPRLEREITRLKEKIVNIERKHSSIFSAFTTSARNQSTARDLLMSAGTFFGRRIINAALLEKLLGLLSAQRTLLEYDMEVNYDL